ncbi:MAG: diguanylate cyclase domain-containing protein [Campylobacterales bacterium]
MNSSFFFSKANLVVLFSGVLLYILLLSVFYTQLKNSAIDTAQSNIREYLRNIAALRSYNSKMQKEEVYRLQDMGVVDKDYFNPILLSSTFSAATTNDFYNNLRKKDGLPSINISFPSPNARNPKNDATQKEAKILEMMNGGEIGEYTEVYDKDGESLLYYAIPTKKTTKECMRCHTDPSLAPKEMVDMYGDKRGFYEHKGDIRALLSTTYPLKKELRDAMREFYKLAGVTLVVFFIIYGISVFFMVRLKARNRELEVLNNTLEDKVKEQTLKIEESRKQLSHVIDGANIGYWDYFVKDGSVEYNSRLAEIMGIDTREHKGVLLEMLKLIYKDDVVAVRKTVDETMDSGQSFSIEFRVQREDRLAWVHGSGGVVEKDENGVPLRISGTLQDISERKEIEEKLRINREYFNLIYNSTPDIVVITSGKELVDANKRFFEFFEEFESIEEFRAKYECICEFFADTNKEGFLSSKDRYTWVHKAIDSGISKVLLYKNEKAYVFNINAKEFRFLGGEMYVVSFSDISQMEKLKDRLEEISGSDELTSLLNRRSFNRIFADEIHRASRDKKYLGFAILDVDFFKEYNDRYGHIEGDYALKSVANEMKNQLRRAGDFAFRLGGEEFGILLSDSSKETIIETIKRVQISIKELKIKHEGSRVSEFLTISVGCIITMVEANSDENTLYKKADDALYVAKRGGRDRVIVV